MRKLFWQINFTLDGVIDEFRFLVTPFLLGRGTRAFPDLPDPASLKLVNATTWRSGIVAATYRKN